MSNLAFKERLDTGKVGESKIASWFMKKGYSVLPVYEKENNDFKGPVIFSADGNKVAPDMIIFNKEKTLWIEAKHKTAFAWHRISQKWTTGIDRYHFNEYLSIARNTNIPIWILFLHKNGVAKDTPSGKVSPTGLYGGEILELEGKINHTHQNWGKQGMVYWSESDLRLIAPLEQL